MTDERPAEADCAIIEKMGLPKFAAAVRAVIAENERLKTERFVYEFGVDGRYIRFAAPTADELDALIARYDGPVAITDSAAPHVVTGGPQP